MTPPKSGTHALLPYRDGFGRGWLGLSAEHDYEPGSAEATAFAIGYRIGKRESLRYAPAFGAQKYRRDGS